jgi:hypothetical protein
MPGWVIVALGFGSGAAVGLLLGGAFAYYMFKARFSEFVPTPGSQQLMICMQQFPFGSDEYYDCVRKCVAGREHSK